MAGDRDHGNVWMRDGDRLMERAGRHLAAFDTDRDAAHLELATHDYVRAAQMYLSGAAESQRGEDAVVMGIARLDVTVQLVEHLDEGRFRREAEYARHVALVRSPPGQDLRSSELEQARTFAESLRDRFSRAAPELFDNSSGPEHSHAPSLSRSR